MSDDSNLAPARRYADALFELARDKGEVDAVVADVVALKGVIDAEPSILRTLMDPKAGREQKKSLADAKLIGGRHRLVGNLVRVLLERRREDLLGEFFTAFAESVERANKVLKVEVETASALGDAARDDLARRIGESSGRPVEITSRVRPELLGGMRFIVDSRLIDGSVAAKLDRLRQRMLQAQA